MFYSIIYNFVRYKYMHICLVSFTHLFDDPDRRLDVYQTWIEAMASAIDLGAPQQSIAVQLLAGTDHVILVTTAGCEKLRV